MADKLLSSAQVIQLLSEKLARKDIQPEQNRFPNPIKLPFTNEVCWFKSEVEGWQNRQTEKSHS